MHDRQAAIPLIAQHCSHPKLGDDTDADIQDLGIMPGRHATIGKEYLKRLHPSIFVYAAPS